LTASFPRLSLRLRVFALVAAVNALVFGAGFVLLSRDLEGRIGAYYAEALFQRLAGTIDDRGEVNVASLLRASNWNWFEDVVVVHKNIESDASGRVTARGALLNPLGSDGRHAGWDQRAVLRACASAMAERRAIPAVGGVAVPIYEPDGDIWGGCWFVLGELEVAQGIGRTMLPWFLGSTLLLTFGTFLLLRRYVLVPVERLARGAHDIADGHAGVRVVVPSRDDELAELVRAFNAMAERVEGHRAELAQAVEDAREQTRRAEAAAMMQRRLAATGELAAGIAHEINNPLGGLINAVEALGTGTLPPERRTRYLQLVSSGLERIQSTVGKLLRLTPRSARTAPFSLAVPLSDALALVAHRAARQGIELVGAWDSGSSTDRDEVHAQWQRLPQLEGESHEVAQAVLNLLVNALDALEDRDPAHSQGRVVLAARLEQASLPGSVTKQPSILVEVSDNGPGVSVDELQRVADLFYTTKDPGRGTGLGLAIVHNVAKEHGGTVHMWSEPGQGFRVQVVLPLPIGALASPEAHA
jgi:signal transduction histidine kinase